MEDASNKKVTIVIGIAIVNVSAIAIVSAIVSAIAIVIVIVSAIAFDRTLQKKGTRS